MWPPETPCLAIGEAVAFLAANEKDPGARDAAASRILTRHAGAAVHVTRRTSGRPQLAPPWPELGVSLSHRDEWLLTGFCPSGDVGVDLELEDDALDVLQLARDHYSTGEYAALTAMTQTDRISLFFRLWCAKEAALKATGRGIADGLRQPDFMAVLTDLRHDGGAVQVSTVSGRMVRVTTRCLALEKGRRFCAALAILI